MAVLNFSNTKVAIGPGKLWVDLGGVAGAWNGAAGVRLILDVSGYPDATQNPNALHVGYTEGGEEMTIKPAKTDFFADESLYPIVSRINQETATITGSALQVMDFDLQEVLNPTALRSTSMGTDGFTFGGSGVLTYTSVAVIFPLEEDPTRFGVFHLYKAYNDQGLAAKITSKALSAIPFAFQAVAIGTRAIGDQAGRFFRQNASGS